MRRTLVGAVVALAAVAVSTGSASAQQLSYTPVDTTKAVVQPLDSVVNVFSGTAKFFNRVIADTIDSNGFVKTINNVFGRDADPRRTTGSTGLPLPSQYPGFGRSSPLNQAMPITGTFGQSVPVTGRR